MENKKAYREVMGQRLKAFREERGLTAYRVAQNGGIRIDQVKAIEAGETNYTIDALLGHIMGSDLYMYFAEKSENRQKPHDYSDIAEMAIKNDPER